MTSAVLAAAWACNEQRAAHTQDWLLSNLVSRQDEQEVCRLGVTRSTGVLRHGSGRRGTQEFAAHILGTCRQGEVLEYFQLHPPSCTYEPALSGKSNTVAGTVGKAQLTGEHLLPRVERTRCRWWHPSLRWLPQCGLARSAEDGTTRLQALQEVLTEGMRRSQQLQSPLMLRELLGVCKIAVLGMARRDALYRGDCEVVGTRMYSGSCTTPSSCQVGFPYRFSRHGTLRCAME